MATATRTRNTPARALVRRHHYWGDGIPDHRGDDRCTECRLPRGREVHDVKPLPDDVIEAELRRMGESFDW